MMINRLLPIFVVLTASVGVANAAGPREPLTFRDAGMYCGWNDYFLRADTPFDFFIVPGEGPFEGRDNSAWSEHLKKARALGKRVIANLNPQVKLADGTFTNISLLTADSTDAELNAFVRVIDEFFAQVDVRELYAITLSEEQIFWNGQAANLNKLYDKLKAKYDVPIYQWYSPSSLGSTPGLSNPNLKADGWVADEYHLDQPLIEQAMRGYTLLRKPIVHIIWAGGPKASVPFIERRFWEQLDVCRKYDIPAAYFTHYGEGSPWGFSDNAPTVLKKTFATVLQAAERAGTTGALSPADRRAWDFVPWEIPTIPLAYGNAESRTATYREEYKVERGLRFFNEAVVRGFANLRWDSSAVELRPREAGPAEASIVYAFESPFAIARLTVSAAGLADAAQQGKLSVSIVDADGKVRRTASPDKSGSLKLVLLGNALTGRRFNVVMHLSGTATAPGDLLASVDFLDVAAETTPPSERVIALEIDGVGGVSHEQSLASMSIYHSAVIRNGQHIIPTPTGLHALTPPGTPVEVVQRFRAPQDVWPTQLRIGGNADGANRGAHFGIGVSRDGVNLLARRMSEGSFNGEFELHLNDLSSDPGGREFFVHLFLEGGHGVITHYGLDGTTARVNAAAAD